MTYNQIDLTAVLAVLFGVTATFANAEITIDGTTFSGDAFNDSADYIAIINAVLSNYGKINKATVSDYGDLENYGTVTNSVSINNGYLVRLIQ